MPRKLEFSFDLLAAMVLLVVFAVAERMPANSSKDCVKFKSEKLIEMVLIASEIRNEEAKKQFPARCISFRERILRTSSGAGLIEAVSSKADGLSKYKETIRMVEARAECIEKVSSMAGSALRSLLSFMKECATEMGQAPSAQLVEQLEAANRELQQQLIERDQLLQQVSSALKSLGQSTEQPERGAESTSELSIPDQIERLRKRTRVCERQIRNLVAANREQSKQLGLKNEAETISNKMARALRDTLEKAQNDLKQMTLEKDDYKRLAEDNASKLSQCLNLDAFRGGVFA